MLEPEMFRYSSVFKKKNVQKQQGFGESSLALQSQQRFSEAENSFSRDCEG